MKGRIFHRKFLQWRVMYPPPLPSSKNNIAKAHFGHKKTACGRLQRCLDNSRWLINYFNIFYKVCEIREMTNISTQILIISVIQIVINQIWEILLSLIFTEFNKLSKNTLQFLDIVFEIKHLNQNKQISSRK